MPYKLGKYVKLEHPLKTEIYKRGFTLSQFSKVSGVSLKCLNSIFTREFKTTRGDTIYCLAKGLGMEYDEVQKLCAR